jgi:hypothetical protein
MVKGRDRLTEHVDAEEFIRLRVGDGDGNVDGEGDSDDSRACNS